MIVQEEDLLHYGIIRRSGRYPWGSGKDENTHNKNLLDHIDMLKKQGMKEVDIAKGLGMSTTQLRSEKSNAKTQQKMANIGMAERLQEKGYSVSAIGRRMGYPESTIRTWLAPGAKDKSDKLTSTMNMLKEEVDAKGMIDVGKGVANNVNVTPTMLNNAVTNLHQLGYEVHQVPDPQVFGGHKTNVKVLAKPGTTQRDVFLNRDKIQQITMRSEDFGRNFYGLHEPIKIDPKRVEVNWAETGGAEADGVMWIRPGVEDISIGGAKYAQVRVSVGDGHYIKGMAVYNEHLPKGTDIVFNTNKKEVDTGGDKLLAFKPIKEDADPNNPYGSVIRQILADKGTPNERVTSAMNVVSEQGDWEKWNKRLSSQMLSKQSPLLVKSQLDFTKDKREAEFAELKSLTNDTVKKKLLTDFANESDAASVHLKAAALPRQATHVILPLANIDPTHVYAPNYNPGERVVLIRHPHGGTFEIPELVVDNKNAEGRKLLGDSRDAIGIHHSVAKRLSGADFDGDTVLVIPNDRGPHKIVTTSALEELKDFDSQASYPGYPGMKPMKATQAEMGKISNLITDMTLHGASRSELARAIKHSMVVIDAEKHNLNYRRSYNDNNIKELQTKYQPEGGAGTLISRKKARNVPPILQRKLRSMKKGGPIDPVTGEKVYEPTNAVYGPKHKKAGQLVTIRTQRLAEVRDAHALSSGTRIEGMYADYSNHLKGMANQARLIVLNTPRSKYSASAKKTYANEVTSLNSKLDLAKKKAPLERQAQRIANANISMMRNANPNMSKETLNKIKTMALDDARNRMGSKKDRIVITSSEWDAIQAGAISDSKLSEILTHADMKIVHQLATPKTHAMMSTSMTNRAKAMLASGYTRQEVAQHLGVSISTLDRSTKEGE